MSLRGLAFALPLAPYTVGTGDVSLQIYIAIGLRPVDSPQLSIEDCVFTFPTPQPGDATLLVADGIFASGECIGLRLSG